MSTKISHGIRHNLLCIYRNKHAFIEFQQLLSFLYLIRTTTTNFFENILRFVFDLKKP